MGSKPPNDSNTRAKRNAAGIWSQRTFVWHEGVFNWCILDKGHSNIVYCSRIRFRSRIHSCALSIRVQSNVKHHRYTKGETKTREKQRRSNNEVLRVYSRGETTKLFTAFLGDFANPNLREHMANLCLLWKPTARVYCET